MGPGWPAGGKISVFKVVLDLSVVTICMSLDLQCTMVEFWSYIQSVQRSVRTFKGDKAVQKIGQF